MEQIHRKLIVIVVCCCLVFAEVYLLGRNQLHLQSYGRCSGSSSWVGRYDIVYEPVYRWGYTKIVDVSVSDYSGLTVEGIYHYRYGGYKDVRCYHFREFENPEEGDKYLSSIENVRLRHPSGSPADNTYAQDQIIVVVNKSSPEAIGPHKIEIKYRWFGFPFTYRKTIPKEW